MNSMQEFFKRIKIRPFMYFGLLILTLILSVIEAYNPIIKNYGSFSYILDHNYIETLSGWTVKFETFLGSDGAFSSILIALLIVLVVSALVSLILSGYINIFICAVDDKKKEKGEFIAGLKKNYLKTMLYLFAGIVMTIPFFFMILYSAVPTLFMIKMFLDGDSSVIFTMLLMALLTFVVALFAIIFYGMYFSYILPAIAGLRRKSAGSGIKMTNTYAWYLLPKTLLFLFMAALIRVLLLVIHYGHQSFALSIVVLLISVILRSFVYYFYAYFVFNTFVAMREDLYPDYQEDIPQKHIARVPSQRKAATEEEPVEQIQEVSEEKEVIDESEIEDEYDDSFDM